MLVILLKEVQGSSLCLNLLRGCLYISFQCALISEELPIFDKSVSGNNCEIVDNMKIHVPCYPECARCLAPYWEPFCQLWS